MNLLIGAATMGFILAPLALGVFIGYRVYRILDLTVDGSFGVGVAVVAALLVRGVPPSLATALAIAAGVAAGIVTGIQHTRFRVSALLAGVLTSTALYSVNLFSMGSGNLSLASAESFVTTGERLAQSLFGLPPSLSILGTEVSTGTVASLAIASVLAVGLAVALARFLATDLGLAMRAAGHNPVMARSVGIDVDRALVLGLGLSNGLIALSGALQAQYEGFGSIQMGIGMIVTGVATLMVGETIMGKRRLGRWIAGAVLGAVVFRLLVAGAIRAGLSPNALKLVTAVFVLGVVVLPGTVRRWRRQRAIAGAPDHA